ncbi:MAG: EndoU domain-containing protein [Candidatus Thiodiazotropha sp.]
MNRHTGYLLKACELQDAVFGPVTPGADSSKAGGVISVEGVDAATEDFGPEYGFDDIAAMPDRREYFERIGDELRGSVVVDQPLSERLKNAGAAAYYGDPNTNTDGIESSVLFAKGFGEQLSAGWQELKSDPFSIIRDPLTLAYDQIETAFYYGTGGLLGDPNSVARNQERAESLLNLGDAVKVSASDSEKAGYIFGGAILGLKKGKLPNAALNGKRLSLNDINAHIRSNWSEGKWHHVMFGDIVDGKLVGGLHSQQGLDGFLKNYAADGKTYQFKEVDQFVLNNTTDDVLVQTLDNGVKRVQLPADMWKSKAARHNSRYPVPGVGNVKGFKSIFPESWTSTDYVNAADSVLKSRSFRNGSDYNLIGEYKGVKVEMYLDRNTGKINSMFPSYDQ